MLCPMYGFCLILVLNVLMYTTGFAEEEKKIQDNSFFIEEAYNQEPGVIQHIQTLQYINGSNIWGYFFTQEWPILGQLHQLSYTIPVSYPDASVKEVGIGDAALNYRYQLFYDETMAISPRFSLLFPTGDYRKGFGTGAPGYQINIPLSIEVSDKWVSHFNVGSTVTPSSKAINGADADTLGFNFGASVIWLASENLNLLCEAAWNSFQSVEVDGTKADFDTFFLNPGARFAVDFESGLQIVPGIAFPIGLGPSKDEYGVFLYLSLEHPLF